MSNLFRIFLLQPLFNGLVLLYENVAFEDLGVAIILLTIIVRIILFPLFHKTAKHQKLAQKIQPEVKKIQTKHKNNKEEQTKALMELYKEHKVNPLTPILLLVLQFPVLYALYRIFINGFSGEAFDLLYSFVQTPVNITQDFLGIIALDKVSIPLAIITAGAQYAQGLLVVRRTSKNKDTPEQIAKMSKFMVYLMPAITLAILMRFSAAFAVYWLTSTLFSIMQQIIVNRSVHDKEVVQDKGKS